MPRRHTDLFPRIAQFSALRSAALKAARGKRRNPGVAAFLANLEPRVLELERTLQALTWQSGRYTEIELREPKPRTVSAAPFRDRVVHHALCAVIGPIFERGFVWDSYASRAGKGTHRAIARYEQYRDRFAHVLRADVFRYFPSIDHEVLKRDLRRRIACPQTLWLLDTVIDGSNPQEPVHQVFPGDDLLTASQRRKGLPIGNLTSQLFGNIYLDPLDHFVKEVLRAPYVRYLDDFALFHDDASVLAEWRTRIEQFLAVRRLTLHPKKTWIAPTAEPSTFLGFELAPGGQRRLPPEQVRRFRNRLRGLRDRWRAGSIDRATVLRRVFAWAAHAEHAQTWRLRHAIFRGGWFDPLWEPDGPPVARVLRGGSWNNNSRNTRSAYRNNNSADNRNNNVGFRLASTPSPTGAICAKAHVGAFEGVHGPS
ncbi:reverse transcriptase domain-containing protein [Tibeticola sp.]|uniref:RNA-directed DNA polymerase n=1 Tax=Tibeticola sp. TaxID=2005368 RepID=UPI0025E98035|nr:reverse transcriptase domain-containing protein [Tibeticola sp.]